MEMNNSVNSIAEFNNSRRSELKLVFDICKNFGPLILLTGMYKLSWVTGEKVNIELSQDDKLVYENKCGKRIEEESENNFLNYYWIEFGIKDLESIIKYKISLFYKDFDSNTGNIHVLPGALQCWKYINNNHNPIYKRALLCGNGINTYNEYGWEPFYKKPLFIKTDKFKEYITIILEHLANQNMDLQLNKGIIQSNNYYYDFIIEREKHIKNKLNKDNKKGHIRRGHYLKYALIEWINTTNSNEFESFQEIFLFRGLGYFSKFGLENKQLNISHSWKLNIPEYNSQVMRTNESKWYYKNFNMVVELDIAGEFIYNGIYELNRMKLITNDAPTFSALYNISVGIERLQKIVLVLWKLNDTCDEKEFEKSLITHNHSLLRDEIKNYAKGIKYVDFNERENEFISLIQEFYNLARYERFNIDGKNNDEITIVKKYLTKYLKDDLTPFMGEGIKMTDGIKELFGRVIGRISLKYYKLVKLGSDKNFTYTFELRSDSKAQKIFLSDYRKQSLMEGQFNEKIAFKEILIYIRNSRDKNSFLKYLEEIKPLHFDPELINDYLSELSEANISQSLIDEVEYLYDEENYSIKRANIVDLIGNTNVLFEYPYIDKCAKKLLQILDNKKINDSIMNCIMQDASYISDDEILSVLDEVSRYYQQYKEGKADLNDFIKQVKEKYVEYQQFLRKEDSDSIF